MITVTPFLGGMLIQVIGDAIRVEVVELDLERVEAAKEAAVRAFQLKKHATGQFLQVK
jgi:hypothetical protein